MSIDKSSLVGVYYRRANRTDCVFMELLADGTVLRICTVDDDIDPAPLNRRWAWVRHELTPENTRYVKKGRWAIEGTKVIVEIGSRRYDGVYKQDVLVLSSPNKPGDRYIRLPENEHKQTWSEPVRPSQVIGDDYLRPLLVSQEFSPNEPARTAEGEPNWQDVSPWIICPGCRQVAPYGGLKSVCPRCVLPLAHGVTFSMTAWDESTRRYAVKFVFPVQQISPREADIMTTMPQAVARNSACSCGSPLELANHTIQINEGTLTFEAVYGCGKCNMKKQGVWRRIRMSITNFWSSTTKVQVQIAGTGLTYEKAPRESNTSNDITSPKKDLRIH